MAERPYQGFYFIFTKQSSSLCIGLNSSALVLKQYAPAAMDLTWCIWPIPASGDSFYLQHLATGNCAHFIKQSAQIAVNPLDITNQTFVLHLDATAENYCVINNHNGSQVFDCKGDGTREGTQIISYPWNQGNNQRWRFVAVGALNRGAP